MLSFRLKIGVWLALTALTLQPALSFGHVHFFEFAIPTVGPRLPARLPRLAKSRHRNRLTQTMGIARSVPPFNSLTIPSRKHHTGYQAPLWTKR
jgi:hypothetical protein